MSDAKKNCQLCGAAQLDIFYRRELRFTQVYDICPKCHEKQSFGMPSPSYEQYRFLSGKYVRVKSERVWWSMANKED